ncbi:hypothetical protein CDD80_2245 [Ophiocordyceps camponoti-rufipedis]|uniref:SMP-30/Gluconolactonase/LRE-like region domain-containing protein n=1 Tax=Ophiocordyceps camponoti-rufipedis TaxID=2004952 RepID=A0A2C5Z845_9HYPO|nr:hypothetical protein CDD80_2245 [Ophiocordyceps camponoti-rufipedis]
MSLITHSAAAAAAMASNSTAEFQYVGVSARDILGDAPELKLLAEDNEPLFHEAGVYFPHDKSLFVTSNQLSGPDGKTVQISRVALADGAAKVEPITTNITMANGGVNYGKGIVFCSQGDMKQPGGLVMMDVIDVKPVDGQHPSTMLVSQFGSRPFNSPNDVVASGDGCLWFTDPHYGSEQGIRPPPELPAMVWRFNPATGSVRAMADGFGRPNGLTFSPDQKTLYSFKVDSFNGEPSLSDRRLFAMCDKGIPDGIKTDTAGNVYSGCGDGINIWSPGGELMGKILVEGGAANFCFGDDGYMFILNEKKLWMAKLAPGVKGALLNSK